MNNGVYAKILAGVLTILLATATIGGFTLTGQVASMGEAIQALQRDFRDFRGRLIYVERAVRDDRRNR